jgi:translation initiation factor IF-3
MRAFGVELARRERRVDHRLNEQIRVTPIDLIDENEVHIGVVPTAYAQKRARALKLDLVEVAPDARPPVCRIMDIRTWLGQHERK